MLKLCYQLIFILANSNILNIKLTIVSNVMWVYWDEKKATHLWKDMEILVCV